MPQTRFVLQKALELNHRVIVVVNKIDKPDARIEEVENEVLELLMDLNATDDQLDSPMLFCSGRAARHRLPRMRQALTSSPCSTRSLNTSPHPRETKTASFSCLSRQ